MSPGYWGLTRIQPTSHLLIPITSWSPSPPYMFSRRHIESFEMMKRFKDGHQALPTCSPEDILNLLK